MNAVILLAFKLTHYCNEWKVNPEYNNENMNE